MVFELDADEIWFPDPSLGEKDGMLAYGGDLSTERLIMAYANGIFPWYAYDSECPILWYCPLNRFVIFPKEIHISHSMRTLINKHAYQVTWDRDFDGVIQGCATVSERQKQFGAWLGPDMIEAFTRLHREGIAHSVEVWDGDKLVGGLYGVRTGNAFCGESMFSLVPSASKLALIFLARKMEAEGVAFIDCQLHTPHLASMGGKYIPYEQYMTLLTGMPYKLIDFSE